MTEPAFTLDTNVLSNYVRQGAPQEYPRLVSWVDDLVRSGGLSISAVTLFELRRGIKALMLDGKGRRKAARLELLLRSVTVLGLDARGFSAWNIAADLWAEGQTRKPAVLLEEADLLIFATARAHDRLLATADRNLMDRLRDLGRADEARLVALA